MFSVIFEVQPQPDRWDEYFGHARVLRPELERIDGFVDNVRYRSLTREGWLLSLSSWRDEKSVVRWRTTMRHHVAQEQGRENIFRDYHLRVGEVTRDTHVPDGHVLKEQRLDETETGAGTTVTLLTATSTHEAVAPSPAERAASLGLDPGADGLLASDVCEAVLTPGDLVLLLSWRDRGAAEAFEARGRAPAGARLRHVRVVRDYAMFDRREAPQYYPEVKRGTDNRADGVSLSHASSTGGDDRDMPEKTLISRPLSQ